jgi:hypothetical protein
VSRFRLSSANFFLLQLLIAPAFLGPLYYDPPGRGRPLVQLLTLLVAPVSYVAVFAFRAARSVARERRASRSIVFSALRSGVAFGAIFGLLVIASLAAVWCRDQWSANLATANAPWILLEGAIVGAFLLLHYLVIGAATGGLVGMAVDVFCRGGDGRLFRSARKAQL